MNQVLTSVYDHLPPSLKSVAATVRGLQLRAWRYGRETNRLVEEAREREYWSRERWEAWEQERLAFILDRAATRVPYYRAQWAARRRRGDRASWHYLENWPVLEKETVRERPTAFLADDRDVKELLHERTSGTTGKPLDLWRSRETVRALYAFSAARSRGWHGALRGDRWAMLGGQMVVPTRRRTPPFWVWNGALRQLYMSTYHLAPDLVPLYLDALARYRIVYLFGYTSSLLPLAQAALDLGRRDLRMKVVITNAEPLPSAHRAVLAEAFQCPVRETYGMGELVAAASECEAERLHLWPEVGRVEVRVDEEGVPAGETGELICTGLLNADMPFIRYRVGDEGRLDSDDSVCACGRTLPRLGGIAGRSNDVLLTRDGRRVFWLNPVFYGLPVSQGQIVQEKVDQIRVRYVAATGFSPRDARTVVERLQARMGGDVEVLLEPVSAIERTGNGKLRAVVCALSPAEREALSDRPRVDRGRAI